MAKKYWNDQIRNITIGSLIAATVLGIVTYLLGFWPNIIAFIFSKLAFLGIEIAMPIWLILLIIILSSLISILALAFLIRDKNGHPEFVNYNEDYLFEIHWLWEWNYPNIYNDKYQLNNLYARCPECGSRLNITSTHPRFIKVSCENNNCVWEWPVRYSGDTHVMSRFRNVDDFIQCVKNEIDRKIHTEEWKSAND